MLDVVGRTTIFIETYVAVFPRYHLPCLTHGLDQVLMAIFGGVVFGLFISVKALSFSVVNVSSRDTAE